MEQVTETLIQLIRSEVCGGDPVLPEPSVLSDVFLIELFNISSAHDVTHLTASAMLKNEALADRFVTEQFRSALYTSVYRYEKFNFVFEQVCSVLEQEKIPYIPLKGMVMRRLYPQPWMRISCDIDILIHESDLVCASNAIQKSLGYIIKGKGPHDVILLSPEQVSVELHFDLVEEERSEYSSKVLKGVWEHAKPTESGKYLHELDGAMFYFYHIAHMAKHFVEGGCGLRPFLDLWILEQNGGYNTPEAVALLKKGRLFDFAQAATDLAQVWFGEKEHSEITSILQEYVMNGGCFGSKETKMLSKQQKHGGRKKYMFRRIFVSYNDLAYCYPRIKKYPFLLPFYEICRLCSLVFGKKRNFRKLYLQRLKNMPDEQVENISTLFERVGL